MKFKKIFALIVVGAILLSGCSNQPSASEESDTYSIVTTTFYEYDWVMEVLGEQKDNFEVTLLMDTGVELHSYAPTAEDIVTIKSADLFVYNGGHSHAWVADVIVETINENFQSLNVVESLGDVVKEEQMVEGMQAMNDDTAHEHEEEAHDHDEQGHDDEHVWLSLHNAMTICELLAKQIGSLDGENADVYVENANAYIETLSQLDQEYKDALLEAEKDTLIFTDRFPFLYLMDDYGINYYAAFQGCSSETDASFETVMFLAEKVDELDIGTLLIIDNGLVELAEIVNSNTANKSSEILTLNSMQSVSKDDIDAGATYYNYMKSNLEVIKQALN